MWSTLQTFLCFWVLLKKNCKRYFKVTVIPAKTGVGSCNWNNFVMEFDRIDMKRIIIKMNKDYVHSFWCFAKNDLNVLKSFWYSSCWHDTNSPLGGDQSSKRSSLARFVLILKMNSLANFIASREMWKWKCKCYHCNAKKKRPGLGVFIDAEWVCRTNKTNGTISRQFE